MGVKKQQLEPDVEHWTDSKLGKECNEAVFCQPAYVTSMQMTSCKVQDWVKNKLGSRLPGEVSVTSDTQMTPPLRQKVKKS